MKEIYPEGTYFMNSINENTSRYLYENRAVSNLSTDLNHEQSYGAFQKYNQYYESISPRVCVSSSSPMETAATAFAVTKKSLSDSTNNIPYYQGKSSRPAILPYTAEITHSFDNVTSNLSKSRERDLFSNFYPAGQKQKSAIYPYEQLSVGNREAELAKKSETLKEETKKMFSNPFEDFYLRRRKYERMFNYGQGESETKEGELFPNKTFPMTRNDKDKDIQKAHILKKKETIRDCKENNNISSEHRSDQYNNYIGNEKKSPPFTIQTKFSINERQNSSSVLDLSSMSITELPSRLQNLNRQL